MAAGPGPVGATRVSSGRDLSCVPEVTGRDPSKTQKNPEKSHLGTSKNRFINTQEGPLSRAAPRKRI
uniref:Uncharacterized protein n=1 Tax=Catharus ustulatus TaxID=91951 RepID=A0A8C3V7Z9_CATUS